MDTASRTLKLALLADTKNFSTGLNKAQRDTQTFGGKMKNIAKGIGAAFTTAGIAIAGMATKLAIDGVKAYSDFAESSSKVNVIFGKNAKAIQDFSKTAAKSFGQSRTQALNAASDFAVFGKSAGLQGPKLVNFSKKLTILSSDFASFYNTSPEDAIIAIGAALRGESEPIRKFGVLLNDATLKAEAMKMGLYSGKGTLDMSAKVLASYQTILKQTTDAQGDFTRTADGLANGQRTLTALWDDAQLTIGEALYPTIKTMVEYLTSPKGQKMITDFAEAFADSMKAVAEVLPGIVSKMSKIVTQVSKHGLVAGLLDNPNIAAAAVAFGIGAAAGGPSGGTVAALAAYAALEGADQAMSGKEKLNIQNYTGGLKNVMEQQQAEYGVGGVSIGGMTIQNQKAQKAFKAYQPASSYNNQFNIWVNGAADSKESARAIERTLKKIEQNGGSLVGVNKYN